jgi:hypothetical protein
MNRPNPRALAIAALATVVVPVLLSGCGGSSSPTKTRTTATARGTAGSPPLTQAQLVRKADAVCASVEEYVAAHRAKSLSEVSRLAPEVAARKRAAAAELERLIPPPALASEWKLITSDVRTSAGYTQMFAGYAASHNLQAIQTLQATANALHQQIATVVTREGIARCSHAL